MYEIQLWTQIQTQSICGADLSAMAKRFKEDIDKKGFLSGIARITEIPLNSGNLVLFFGRQKRRFARMTEFFLMMIMMV